VEGDKGKASVMLKNACLSEEACHVRIRCHFLSVELYVMKARGPAFDYIFCDPPFKYAFKWDLLKRIAASALMRGGTEDSPPTLLMLHRPRADYNDNTETECGLKLIKRSEYGRSIVDFLQKI
jgi:16S rRNA G966 N2-methylase RsmD